MRDSDDFMKDINWEEYRTEIEDEMEHLSELYEELQNATSKRAAKRLRKQYQAQRDNVDELMEEFDALFENLSDDLDETDEAFYNTFYKNRIKDLKTYDAMYKKMMRKQNKTMKGFFDDAEEGFEGLSDSVSRMAQISSAINLDKLTGSLEDSTADTVDSLRNIQQSLGLTQSEMKEFRSDISDYNKVISKEFGGRISQAEYTVQLDRVISEIGVRDKDRALEFGRQLAIFEKATGESSDVLDSVVKTYDSNSWDPSAMEGIMDDMRMLTSKYEVSYEALAGGMESMSSKLESLSGGDQDKYQQLSEDLQKSIAMIETSYADSSKIMDIFSSNQQDFIDQMKFVTLGGGDINSIWSKVQAGQFDDATAELMDSIGRMAAEGNLNTNQKKMIQESFGISGDEWEKIANQYRDQTYTEMNEAMSKQLEDAGGAMADQVIESVHVGFFEKMGNKLSSSALGQWWTGVLDDTGIGDIFNNTFIQTFVANYLAELLSKKGGGWIKGLFKGKGASGAGGFFKGMFSKGKGFLGGILSKGKGFFGKTASTFGDDALRMAASSAGTASKAGGILSKVGSVASKASGPLAFLGLGIDGILGATKTKDWFGEDAGVGKGFASFLGGALGGTGPGILDEGSVGEKALNIGGGALKGAGIGATIGSVVPGIGTAIGAGVGGVIGAVGSAIGGENIAKAFSWVGDRIKDAGSMAWEGIKTAGGWIADGAKSAGAFIGEKFKDLGGWLSEKGKGLLDGAIDFGKGALDIGKGLLSKGKDALGKGVSWLGDKASDAADWLGEKVFGKKDKDGSHASGLTRVPFDGYMAELHKDEAVLNKSEADKWRKGTGSVDMLVQTFRLVIKEIKPDVEEMFKDSADVFVKQQIKESKRGTSGGLLGSLTSGIKSLFGSQVDGSHEDGLDRVPYDGYVAETHKDEAILTATEAENWRRQKNAQYSLAWVKDSINKAFESNKGYKPGQAGTGAGSVNLSGDYEKDAWSLIRGLGYSKQATAGVMGNAYAESGVNPTTVQSGGKGPAAGMFQWENYNTKSGRWLNMSNHAKSKGREWTDLQSQIEWMDQEMQGKDSTTLYHLKNKVGGYDKFKALTDINTATRVFEESFERAGVPAMQKRYNAANQYYQKYNAYAQGTPYVPNTGLALIHKGEAIIPEKYNPIGVNGQTKASAKNVSSGNEDVVEILKWGFEYLGKKINDLEVKVVSKSQQVRYSESPAYFATGGGY